MKFQYKTIKSLGFKEQKVADSVFFDQYGFDYTIIEKQLTKRVYLDWSKETQICELIRCTKSGTIVKKKTIESMEELETLIEFFT